VLRWGSAARVGIQGLAAEGAWATADRWCGVVESEPAETGPELLRLIIPPTEAERRADTRTRIRVGAKTSDRGRSLELRVGAHAVVTGGRGAPDALRLSSRRPPTGLELELLVDLGINHLLARQGLPTLHACAFDLNGVAVLGLGDSFAGKTTVSVAAMGAGGGVVSDDAVLVIPEDGRSSLLPVRSFGWLRGRTREIVPAELRDRMVENEENGQPRWVLSRRDAGAAFVDRLVPDVIWVQSVDRRLRQSRVERIDHGLVFAALIRASSPIYVSRHCPEIRERLIPVFRSLCAQCPGYRVRLGRRLLDDPSGEISRLVELSG
jgi:hypothetical protein